MSAVEWLLVSPPKSQANSIPRPEFEIRDEERRLIARELHDSTSQLLVSLQLGLASLKRNVADAEREKLFSDLDLTLDELHHEVRSVTSIASAPPIRAGQLPRALEDMVVKFGRLAKLSISFDSEGLYAPPSAKLECSLFRIAQEALANVWRHARAQRVRVSLSSTATTLDLIIEDNGIGIPRHRRDFGLGLNNIQSRADELGGQLKVEHLRCGTRLVVSMDSTAA